MHSWPWRLFFVAALAAANTYGFHQGGGASKQELSESEKRMSAEIDASWERHNKLPATTKMLQDLKSKDVKVRRNAVRVLNKLEPDFNIEFFDQIGDALTKALEDPDPTVGDLAAHAFSRIRCGSYPPNERIFKLLDSPRPEVVKRTVTALRVAESQAFDAAEGVRILENPKATSAERLRAIGLVDRPFCSGYQESLVIKAFSDPSATVRASVLRTLGKAQCAGAFDTLVAGSKDADPGVRKAALQAMHETYDRRILGPIRSRLHDPDAGVKKLAMRLASDLSKMDGGYGPVWPRKRPKFLDTRIGDLELQAIGHVAVLDPKRWLFLATGGECDGADKWMALSSEPGGDLIPQALNDMVEAPIGNLKTGKGIGLGDSRDKVWRVLGKPKRSQRGSGRTVDSYTYQYKGYVYGASYAFRGSRLVGIVISRSALEGC